MSDLNLVEKLEQIVCFLSGVWYVDKLSIDKNSYRFYIISANGRRVGFRYDKHKINVFPVWPSIKGNHRGQCYNNSVYPKGNKDKLSINFSLNRSAKSIAKDIENRFLNEYLKLFSECLIEKKKIIDKRNNLSHVVEAFKRIDMNTRVGGNVDYASLSIGSYKKGATADINLSVTSDYCSMELKYVPLDVAMKISAMIKESQQND
jgi:hypothetical protein